MGSVVVEVGVQREGDHDYSNRDMQRSTFRPCAGISDVLFAHSIRFTWNIAVNLKPSEGGRMVSSTSPNIRRS